MSSQVSDAQYVRSLQVIRTLFANYGLLGISFAMFLIWVSNCRRDSLYTKLTVCGMFIANGLQTAGLTIGVWSNIVDNWNNRAALLQYHFGFKISNGAQFLVGSLAQAFYLNRIYKLSQNWIVVGAGALLALGNLASGLCQYIYRLATPGFTSPQKGGQFALAYLWLTLVAEIYIAAAFIYYINRERRGHNETTDGVIFRLIKIAIEGSVVPCVCAVGSALTYTVGARHGWVAFYTQIAPSYLIGVLYSLNSRRGMRDQIESGRRNPNVSAYSLTASRTGGTHYLNKEPVNGVNLVSLDVRVETEKVSKSDVDLQPTESKA